MGWKSQGGRSQHFYFYISNREETSTFIQIMGKEKREREAGAKGRDNHRERVEISRERKVRLGHAWNERASTKENQRFCWSEDAMILDTGYFVRAQEGTGRKVSKFPPNGLILLRDTKREAVY